MGKQCVLEGEYGMGDGVHCFDGQIRGPVGRIKLNESVCSVDGVTTHTMARSDRGAH